jgi:hypothetical protein
MGNEVALGKGVRFRTFSQNKSLWRGILMWLPLQVTKIDANSLKKLSLGRQIFLIFRDMTHFIVITYYPQRHPPTQISPSRLAPALVQAASSLLCGAFTCM